jgi:hypothetical protein
VESEQVFEVGKLGMDVDVHLKVKDWKLGCQKADSATKYLYVLFRDHESSSTAQHTPLCSSAKFACVCAFSSRSLLPIALQAQSSHHHQNRE